MIVRQPALEFLLVQADPPPKSAGGIIQVTEKGYRPTTGKVLAVGHKAAEEGYEASQRVLWAKEAITIAVKKDEEAGDTLIIHVENMRAVIE